jgi:DNA-3-methyladenine glycosylase II
MHYLHQVPRIRDGIEHLLANDPVFGKRRVKPEDLDWSYHGPGFAGLVRIVIGQQISTAAANALWERFKARVPCIRPSSILALDDDDMRMLGLSYQKASYIRGLARAVKEKKFDPDGLQLLTDQEVFDQITALRGFGSWSAQMYLMFCLARPNVWPSGDLGIQEGVKLYGDLSERPDKKRTEKEGTRFAPYCTAASLLLWHLKQAG